MRGTLKFTLRKSTKKNNNSGFIILNYNFGAERKVRSSTKLKIYDISDWDKERGRLNIVDEDCKTFYELINKRLDHYEKAVNRMSTIWMVNNDFNDEVVKETINNIIINK